MMNSHDAIDIAFCFPPQWSPFQPPLSIPALEAWIRREGFTSDVVDANIEFYHFLLENNTASMLIEENAHKDDLKSQAAIAALQCASDFAGDVNKLLEWSYSSNSDFRDRRDEVLWDTYRAANSLDTYLKHISAISPRFEISPYSFNIKPNTLRAKDIADFIENPPRVLLVFIDRMVKRLLEKTPRYIGLSCIGQEQLIFTMMFGKRIKQLSSVKVIIGGTVMSRVYEKGVLPAYWFNSFFDVIVRNEGEEPLAEILGLKSFDCDSLSKVGSIVYHDAENNIIATKTFPALKPSSLPIPSFEKLPLGRYITSRITLPLLASRGCYWGKCEFCHHGMVYGDKYSPAKVDDINYVIRELQSKYHVDYFAFNDEAIPPNTLRKLFLTNDSGIERFFTGLLKFEKFYTLKDFQNAYDAGFRSIYIGLESASERVLTLMKKNTSRDVMESNLSDAAHAGLWSHCFAFFGFPGETEEDAQETIDFLSSHSKTIGSFGCGTFSLEHNSPIMRRLKEHGLTIIEQECDSLDVYYDYNVSHGLSQKEACDWNERNNALSYRNISYLATNWIPREQLLVLLSIFSREALTEGCKQLLAQRDIETIKPLRDLLSSVHVAGSSIIVNRVNNTAVKLSGATSEIFILAENSGLPALWLSENLPSLSAELSSKKMVRLSLHDVMKAI